MFAGCFFSCYGVLKLTDTRPDVGCLLFEVIHKFITLKMVAMVCVRVNEVVDGVANARVYQVRRIKLSSSLNCFIMNFYFFIFCTL